MTITVSLPDGSTAEVAPDALTLPDGAQILAPGTAPKGFVAEDYHKAEVQRRSKDSAALRRDLQQDASFRAEVLKEFGIPLSDDGKPAIPDVSSAVQTARQKWEAEQLAPVAERLTGLQTSLARQALQTAAKGLVRDEFATPPIPGAPSYIETVLGSRVRYDADLGYVVALDADGKTPLPSGNPQSGRPYADAAEFVASFIASDAGAMLRRETPKQSGPGYRGADGSGSGKTMGRAAFDALNPTERAALMAVGGRVTD